MTLYELDDIEKGTEMEKVLTKSELRAQLEAGLSKPLSQKQIESIYRFCLTSVNAAHMPELIEILTDEKYGYLDMELLDITLIK